MNPQQKYDEWQKGCSNGGPVLDELLEVNIGTTSCEDCKECTNGLISSLAKDLRKIAEPCGSMHSYWDRISDMEAFVKGQPTIVHMTATEWIEEAMNLLKENK